MKFSIIIPSHNRPERLRSCLEAISRLSYPSSDFEVVVVDDGSPRPLRDAVTAKPFAQPFALRFLRQQNAGPATARNLATDSAAGRWLVFLDDDCVPRPDWLSQFDEAVGRHPACLLAGRTRNGRPSNIFAETNQSLVDFVVDWFHDAQSPHRFFPSNNIAVPANAFREIGGFDESFPAAGGEDREFCSRWLASGRSMVRVHDAWIDHYHPQDLISFLRMHYRYGRGAALLHRGRSTSPVSRTSWAFYRDLFRLVLQSEPPAARRLITLGVLALSQAATAAGFFAEQSRPGKPPRLRLAPRAGTANLEE